MHQDIINTYVHRAGFGFPIRSIAVMILWVAIWVFLASALLMWLWNITMTRIFNLREITYWEAFRLMLIAGLLFGGGFGFNMAL